MQYISSGNIGAVKSPSAVSGAGFRPGAFSSSVPGSGPGTVSSVPVGAGIQRSLRVQKLQHAYRDVSLTGVSNWLKDSIGKHVFLDGRDCGVLKTDSEITVHMDGGRHELQVGRIGPKCLCPAGTDSYLACFFNGELQAGFLDDPFRDVLAGYVRSQYRSRNFHHIMADSNNRYHSVGFRLGPQEITFFWSLVCGHTLKERLSGEGKFTVPYSQIGAVPRRAACLPDGYWSFTERYVGEVLLKDQGLDLVYCPANTYGTWAEHH